MKGIVSKNAASNPAILMPTSFTVSVRKLRKTLSGMHFADEGDRTEQQYWPILKNRFPNCERFWRELVLPVTKRIELPPGDPDRIRRREGVSEDVWTLSYLNYSFFLHLAAAYDHLRIPLNSSVGDFYTHLGSTCDLAEEFLQNAYFIVAECRSQAITTLQKLSKEDFVELAGHWYDEHYPNLYEYYLKHGKGKPSIELPKRAYVIDEYLYGETSWKKYKSFSGPLRTYRNRIVHDVAMGNVIVGNVHLVPRKKRIASYRKLQDVFDAAKVPPTLKQDFVVREDQMRNDFHTLQELLNALWEKPIGDLAKLLYEDRSSILLAKYNLRLTKPQ